jgi:hypothetical protein
VELAWLVVHTMVVAVQVAALATPLSPLPPSKGLPPLFTGQFPWATAHPPSLSALMSWGTAHPKHSASPADL